MKLSCRNVLRLSTMAFVLLSSTSVFAVDWYVKTTGNNAALGTSWATALQTISQAVLNSNDGDIIYVEGGTYIEQVEIVNKTLTIQEAKMLVPV